MIKNSSLLLLVLGMSCGGYEAADPNELKAREGEIVGVLVDGKGKSHPDALIQLIAADGTAIISSNNMDSDGRFSLWPTAEGTYNIIGVISDTEKVIVQDIVVTENRMGLNLGRLQAVTVGGLTVRVSTPEGYDPKGTRIDVLGTAVTGTTLDEGLGAVVGIPAGTFDVVFSKTGLQSTTVENVVFKSGEAAVLDDVVLTAP